MEEGKSKKAKGKSKSGARRAQRPLPFYFFLFTFSLLLASAAAAPAATRVYAKVETETAIYPGDEFAYSIVVEGGSRPSQIDIAPLAPFHPRQGVGDNSTRIVVNGRATVTFARSYVITAGKAGVMHLPGVKVVVDGQTYTTNPVDVTVSPPGSTDQMTLELSLSEKRCYVGQPLVLTVQWTIKGGAEGGRFDIPVFRSDDFYIEEAPEPANLQPLQQAEIQGIPVTIFGGQQLVRGMTATVLSFRKVLIPKRAGRLRLDPATVSANVAVGRELVDGFFGPSYRLKYQRVSVSSSAIDLDVQAMPETGRPPQFYGLIGPYTIAASAAPTQVNVGDPITLTIRIGGNPYLKPVQWPALEQVPELANNFRIPAEKAAPTLEGGAKVFTQTIRANSDKVTQIPAIPLAYFDPARGAYTVAKTEPIKLEVAPAKVLTNVDVQGTASSAPVNREVEAIRKGLSANYYGPEVLENQSSSVLALAANPACAALWSIPLLVLIVSAGVKVAGRTSPEAIARKRRRRAAGIAQAQLKKVTSAEPGQRHELLLAALKGYIGDRFDRVAASLTADDCHRILADATGDATTAVKYKELIDTCEAARYTPLQAKIGPDQVQTAIELVQSAERQGRGGRFGVPPSGGKDPSDPRKRGTPNRRSSLLRRSSSGFLLLILCLILPARAIHAAPVETQPLASLLQEANAAFQAANAATNPEAAKPLYDKAILLYEKIIDQGGIHNAKLYYNLANAYLLKDDLGRAILNYRRAETLDRSDVNIRKNLTFARSRRVDRVETSTQRRVLETLFFWHYDFSARTKFLLASAFFAALCVALTLIVWRGRGPATGTTAILSGVLLAALLLSLAVEARRQRATRPGVITAAEIVARQGDGPNYPPSFKDPLHAGMEFDLIEHRPGWLHIRLSDGADAWVPDDTAGLV